MKGPYRRQQIPKCSQPHETLMARRQSPSLNGHVFYGRWKSSGSNQESRGKAVFPLLNYPSKPTHLSSLSSSFRGHRVPLVLPRPPQPSCQRLREALALPSLLLGLGFWNRSAFCANTGFVTSLLQGTLNTDQGQCQFWKETSQKYLIPANFVETSSQAEQWALVSSILGGKGWGGRRQSSAEDGSPEGERAQPARNGRDRDHPRAPRATGPNWGTGIGQAARAAPAPAANGLRGTGRGAGSGTVGLGTGGKRGRGAPAQPRAPGLTRGLHFGGTAPSPSADTGPREVLPYSAAPSSERVGLGWAGQGTEGQGRTGQGSTDRPLAPPGGAERGGGGASAERRVRAAPRALLGTMGRDGQWLNLSGSACATGGPFPAGTAALLAALMGLLVLATVLGNALVILAFVVDRSLRTQGNFFFLNLAVADLLVGECRGAAGRGWAPLVSPPSSVRRRLLHPPLHPLRADGRVEARQGLV